MGSDTAPTPNVIPDPIGNPARRVGGARYLFLRAGLPALDSRLRGNDEVSGPSPPYDTANFNSLIAS